MVYDDVVKPAITGTVNAKHGNTVILLPGVIKSQSANNGISKPVSKDENVLSNRFDDRNFYGNSFSGNVTFLNNGLWLCPHGVNSLVTIKAWGQGGYGQTPTIGGGFGGWGGGGGAYSEATFTPIPGRIYDISVNNGIVNGDGGDSSFELSGTTYCLAKGGKSGDNGSDGGIDSEGTGNITKTSGANGYSPTGNYGGGEGGTGANGGSGGPGGADIGDVQGPGTDGETPGGGGGGGSLNSVLNIAYSGGKGGLGKVIISW